MENAEVVTSFEDGGGLGVNQAAIGPSLSANLKRASFANNSDGSVDSCYFSIYQSQSIDDSLSETNLSSQLSLASFKKSIDLQTINENNELQTSPSSSETPTTQAARELHIETPLDGRISVMTPTKPTYFNIQKSDCINECKERRLRWSSHQKVKQKCDSTTDRPKMPSTFDREFDVKNGESICDRNGGFSTTNMGCSTPNSVLTDVNSDQEAFNQLQNFSPVKRDGKRKVLSDKKLASAVDLKLNARRLARAADKENVFRRGNTIQRDEQETNVTNKPKKRPFKDLNTIKTEKVPELSAVSPSTRKFQENQKVVCMLKPDQRIMKCSACCGDCIVYTETIKQTKSSKFCLNGTIIDTEYAKCTKCAFRFCTNCRGQHEGLACTLKPLGSSPNSEDEIPPQRWSARKAKNSLRRHMF